MKRWIFILLLGLAQSVWAVSALAQEINAFVDHDTVTEGETLRLTIEVSERNPNGDPDLSPLSSDFQILGSLKASQVNIINGAVEAKTRWTVMLVPQKTGSLTIPALAVGNQHTQAITIQVTGASTSASASASASTSASTGANAGAGAGASTGTTSTTGATPDFFIESEIKPNSAYVQQQLIDVVRIYYAVSPSQPQLSNPKAGDALVERLGDARQYMTQRNGRRYGVFEQHYAIFPQSSGTLTIESPIFSAQIPDTRRQSIDNDLFGPNGGLFGPNGLNSMFQTTRPIQVGGQSTEITVKARPSQSNTGAWLPAEDLTVAESWSPDPPTFRVGEPVTRTLVLKARGLSGAQLPELPLPTQADLKLYPDRPTTDTKADVSGVLGQREQKIAIVPTRAGTFQLPEIHISWWDTKADAPREAVIPARKITVVGASATSSAPAQPALPAPQATQASTDSSAPNTEAQPKPPTSTAPATPSDPTAVKASPSQPLSAISDFAPYWPWIALTLLIVWIATLLLWWRTRMNPARGIITQSTGEQEQRALSQREAWRELQRACQANDAEWTKKALLHWAKTQWPRHPPRSVLGVAKQIDHQEIRNALEKLDHNLYQGDVQSWNGEALYHAIADLRKKVSTERIKKGAKGTGLPELYPTT